MTGGSDDAPPPNDGRGAVDDAWDALIDEVGGGEAPSDEDVVQPVKRPVSGPLGAVGRDRLAEPDDEMARLMSGTPPQSPAPKKLDPRALTALTSAGSKLASSRSGKTPRAAKPSSGVPGKSIVSTAGSSGAPKESSKIAESSSDAPSQSGVSAAGSSGASSQSGVSAAGSSGASKESSKSSALSSGAPGKSIVSAAGSSSDVSKESSKSSASPKPLAIASPRPSLRVVEGSKGDPSPEPSPVARASRPAEPLASAPTPAPAPEPSGGLPWMWIGVGVVALAAVAFVAIPDSPPASKADSVPAATTAADVASSKSPSSDPPSRPPASDVSVTDSGSGEPPPSGETSESPTPSVRSGDPREPPPGTPEEIAAVFRRLPVSPSDGPPIGGIGANGVHIDKLTMGSSLTRGSCTGKADDFSVSGLDRVGVCVRVVHPRVKEELQVLWQKHGGTTRRSKMVVLAKHAYRTRGYLKLRREYIGDWTVRILSSDGVELARHDFTVVP